MNKWVFPLVVCEKSNGSWWILDGNCKVVEDNIKTQDSAIEAKHKLTKLYQESKQ